jgi:hypothetical protein
MTTGFGLTGLILFALSLVLTFASAGLAIGQTFTVTDYPRANPWTTGGEKC